MKKIVIGLIIAFTLSNGLGYSFLSANDREQPEHTSRFDRYYEYFDVDWATTGWIQEPTDGNWLWSPGYAYLYWSPTLTNYDMSLISPMIELPNNLLDIFDLTVSMYIDDYSPDTGEFMEIWVVHDTGEDMIFEWDLDMNDDWGVSGGSDWIYENMSQYAGQTIQLKFRSHGGSTYNFNHWYIYSILLDTSWVPYYGAIEGIVTDADGLPLEMVRVTADETRYNPVWTNENGYYLYNPVRTGMYDIEFYLDGYTTEWVYDVEVTEDDTTIVNMILGNPTMEIYPTSLSVMIPAGGSATEIVTVNNNGTDNLEWYIDYFPDGNKTSDNDLGKKTNIVKISNNTSEIKENPTYISCEQTVNKSPWDLLYSFPCATSDGETGVETNGTYIYTTSLYGDATFQRYEMDGTYVVQFTVSGCQGNIRDLAYDGEYFYGGSATNTVYILDLDNEQLIDSILAPTEVRAIAYDPYSDHFWANNWSSDITSFDRSGNYITSFPCGSYGNYYGLAYDIHSENWPYLWGFSQDGSGGVIVQMDATTGIETGFTFDVIYDIGLPDGLAGGLYIDEWEMWGGNNIAVIGGLVQNSTIFGYYLCSYPPQGNLMIDPTTGTVAPGNSQEVNFDFYALDDPPGTVYSGKVIFRSHQNVPSVPVSICLMITYPEYGSLSGVVTDSNGNPVEGVEVHAYNDSYHYITYTNANGIYFIEDMVTGNYTVEFLHQSYNVYVGDPVIILADQTTILNVVLTAPIMIVEPQFIPVHIPYGVTDTTKYFTIFNEGDGPLDFNINVYDITKHETDYSRFICDDELVSLKSESIAGTSSFTATQNRDNVTIQYQTGYDFDGIGTGEAFSAICAARFTADEIDPYYDTYSLTQVNIHIRSVDFSLVEIKVWEGGSYGDPGIEVYSQDITDDIVVDDWTTITLSTPIQLVYGNEYWIGYAIDATADHPCSVDAGPMATDKGAWTYYSGTWSLLTDLNPALDYNWCIQGILCTGHSYWINIDPISGTIPAYSQMDITVALDATGLIYGLIYLADVEIVSTPDVGADTVEVLLVLVDTVSTQNSIVKETTLHPNFPNPVLNNTTFEFSLKELSQVTLSIYNLKGQLVTTLLDEELDPSASHCVEWDGTANGKKLANGIYFYKLETDKKLFLKKMVLMR